ncbi:TonB protein C-terminal [Cyclobacterium xiamenense]|uniref:TonB protein C-terminal n=1 Tax=Cyclobacterium xiamenense TaxID=1297121 RepID=A0A1H6ZUW9_9BACT|nr:energy transducer TonB [Cyclobacterium xiamenense]SEJ57131.1 TonB protein C-terminal [Cyclobacterium xiamenense]
MKTLQKAMKLVSIPVTLLFVFMLSAGAQSQQDGSKLSGSELERMQDRNMNYMFQINEIIKDYPAFSYSYKMKDGELDDVVVTGVDNEIDRKKLEVIMFDLKSNRNKMKSKANRMGVFYSVDEEADFEGGEEALRSTVLSNLEYPESAKNWGLEGTIFVKFVVDENGDIPFATTSSNIETSMERYLTDMEAQAIKAIKATSGEWEPAEVENVEVASLSVLPITFDFEKNPTLPALIR